MSQMIAVAHVRPFVRSVNTKTAKALDNNISDSILLRADKVIE